MGGGGVTVRARARARAMASARAKVGDGEGERTGHHLLVGSFPCYLFSGFVMRSAWPLEKDMIAEESVACHCVRRIQFA